MHPSKELRSEIRSFIEQNYLLGQSNNFADDASLLEHQVMDSTGVLELVSFLEGRFGVQVADEELLPENLDSIELIAQFVMRKRTA
ncbi:MAG: acyl carrier protein [Steroidobacteraceae bacterium]